MDHVLTCLGVVDAAKRDTQLHDWIPLLYPPVFEQTHAYPDKMSEKSRQVSEYGAIYTALRDCQPITPYRVGAGAQSEFSNDIFQTMHKAICNWFVATFDSTQVLEDLPNLLFGLASLFNHSCTPNLMCAKF
jgi:hypothetical protein